MSKLVAEYLLHALHEAESEQGALTDQLIYNEDRSRELREQTERVLERLRFYEFLISDLRQKIQSAQHAFESDWTETNHDIPMNTFATALVGKGATRNALSGQLIENQKPTTKEMVWSILQSRPNGLTVTELMEYLQAIYGVDIPRPNLSPVLSRMKSEGLLSLEDDCWKIPVHLKS